jgi:hypothetical protein
VRVWGLRKQDYCQILRHESELQKIGDPWETHRRKVKNRTLENREGAAPKSLRAPPRVKAGRGRATSFTKFLQIG